MYVVKRPSGDVVYEGTQVEDGSSSAINRESPTDGDRGDKYPV
jgi:hypothetical protein